MSGSVYKMSKKLAYIFPLMVLSSREILKLAVSGELAMLERKVEIVKLVTSLSQHHCPPFQSLHQ
jgi:hypothetical protein